MFQAIHEQRAVRQPGKQIVERLITELLYQGFAFGDVPGVDHHTPHSRVVDQVVYDMLKVAPGAILVGHSELQGRLKPGRFRTSANVFSACSLSSGWIEPNAL